MIEDYDLCIRLCGDRGIVSGHTRPPRSRSCSSRSSVCFVVLLYSQSHVDAILKKRVTSDVVTNE